MLNSLTNREREYHIFSTERWGRDCVFKGGSVSNNFGINRGTHNRHFSFMFCIPISDHVMVPQRTAFFKCHPIHVRPHA